MSTHACPGRCGTNVPPRHVACRPCWWRLPTHLREAINDTYRRDPARHRQALRAAIQWYQDNPLPAKESRHG